MYKKVYGYFTAMMLLICCVCCMNVTVRAESYEDYEYEVLEDGTIRITKYQGSEQDVVIPESIEGKTVTSIGAWAFHETEDSPELGIFTNHVKSVKMPNTIKIIEDNAFMMCMSLEKVELSNSLVEMKSGAFWACMALKEIKFPQTLQRIGAAAFENCHELKKVEIPESVQEIAKEAFCCCMGLEEILVDLQSPYFMSVNGVLFDKSQTVLKQYPTNKEGDVYVIPASVTEIAQSAFGSSKLKEITIPEKVTTIGLGAFHGCKYLSKITVENSRCIIGKEVEGLALQPVTLGYNAVIYGYAGSTAQEYAKKHNKKFAVIGGQPDQDPQKKLPQKGEKLTDTKTKAVYTVTKAGETLEYAGASNKKVSAVTIPQKITIDGVSYQVTSIGKGACKNYKNMKKVTIPASVGKIGKQAFAGCKKLKTITIKTKKLTAKTVGAKAFKGIHKKAVVKVPRAKKKAYKELLKAKGAGKSVKVK